MRATPQGLNMDYALHYYDPLFIGCVHNCFYDAHLEPMLLYYTVNLKDVPACVQICSACVYVYHSAGAHFSGEG